MGKKLYRRRAAHNERPRPSRVLRRRGREDGVGHDGRRWHVAAESAARLLVDGDTADVHQGRERGGPEENPGRLGTRGFGSLTFCELKDGFKAF